MSEHWAEKEIKNLKVEKIRLEDEKEREDIWSKALSDPETGWRLPPKLENSFRENGFEISPNSELTTSWIEFKRRLLRGACEYIQKKPPADNRITAWTILKVLESHREFGYLVNHSMINRWIDGRTEGFQDIVEDFAIDVKPYDTVNERYGRAIRQAWRVHNKDTPPSFSAIGRLLGFKSPSSAKWKIMNTPSLKNLWEKKPNDL